MEKNTMKRKWKLLSVAASIAAVTMTMLSVLALPTPYATEAQAAGISEDEPIEAETKVTNSVETGVVDISLSQGYLDEYGNRVSGSAVRQLMPGKDMSLIPTISNEGNDCYVRIRLTSVVYDEDGQVSDLESPFDTSDLYGVSDDWKIIGDYLYYTKVFSHGESTDVFEGFAIPQSLGNEYAGKTCEVTIVADAVQADFFTADFKSDSPWGDLTTEECIREGYDYESLRVAQDVEISVTYTGGADNFVVVPDDFFAHFAAMVPGGSYTGTVAVKNTYTEDTQLYFKTGVIENDNDLLELMQLEIVQVYDDGAERVLYDGDYNSVSLQSYISLGLYGEGEGCNLRFTITVPEDLDNTYTLTSGKIDWYFKAESYIPAAIVTPEPITSEEPSDTSGDYLNGSTATPTTYTSTGSYGTTNSASSGNAKTGDDTNVYPYVIAAMLSALVLRKGFCNE